MSLGRSFIKTSTSQTSTVTSTVYHLSYPRSKRFSYFYPYFFARDMYDPPGSRLQSLFETALEVYEKQTGMKLIDHPVASQLENCNSVESIMNILQQQARHLSNFRGNDSKVMKSLQRVVHVLYTLSSSTALGEGIGLVRLVHFLGIPYS